MGINDNMLINGSRMGTAFRFLQTPMGNSGKPAEEVNLLYIAGRQIALRDVRTDQVSMVALDEPAHQVTALATHFSGDQSRIAMAESDFNDPSQLYFSIFDVNDDCQARPLFRRVRIDLPNEDMVEDEMRARLEGQGARPAQEFTSAASNASPGLKGSSGVGGAKKDDSPSSLPFVSQICFANSFTYVAVLISGSVNRVVVYETPSYRNEAVPGKPKLVAFQNFPVQSYLDDVAGEPDSPMNGDQSRISSQTVHQQSVT